MPSSDLAISVRDLGKAYEIVHGALKRPSFGELVMERLRNPLARQKPETFWALRGVDLDIHKGDVLGIIGRNGAGKSTMLKLLNRITEPTEGMIDLYGRVGSLLEVGTGFHPELTGRENIYLNGSVLGMRRKEIERQFDAIVDFAEVEKFLDTPVKRYSSGMYVRLAFAVAAHLNPEILVVDEVLAVGDSQFQNKCLGKMGEVARSGRTVLLVSHNMAAVSNLCTRAAVLNGGKVHYVGDTESGIRHYMTLTKSHNADDHDLRRCRPGWATPLIQSARTVDEEGKDCQQFFLGGDITFEMEFDTAGHEPISAPVMGVVVRHPTLGVVGGVNTRMSGFESRRGPYTRGVMRCRIKDAPLLQGSYSADLWLGDGPGDLDTITGFLKFEIEAADVYKTGASPFRHMGTIFLKADWELDDGGTDKTGEALPETAAGAVAPGVGRPADGPAAVAPGR